LPYPSGRQIINGKVTTLLGSRPFQVKLDLGTGSLTPFSDSFVRRLSEMAGAYEDKAAVRRLLADGDPVIYTGFDADVPFEAGHLVFRTTIISPGTVGSEFFMTKGHHHVRDSAELYVGMSGEGVMVMESRDGGFAHEPLTPSAAVYVPPGWAHRTVNTGTVPLSFLAVYFGDAGHDYESIEKSGFSKRVYHGETGPELRGTAAE
jgi:glucose-6-phosphate isomerase, archaeal